MQGKGKMQLFQKTKLIITSFSWWKPERWLHEGLLKNLRKKGYAAQNCTDSVSKRTNNSRHSWPRKPKEMFVMGIVFEEFLFNFPKLFLEFSDNNVSESNNSSSNGKTIQYFRLHLSSCIWQQSVICQVYLLQQVSI